MTISSSVRTAGPFTGTGLVSSFPFVFKVFTTADLLVQQTDTSGVITKLVLSTQYTVTLNADQDVSPGGTVTLSSALASGYTLSITSNLSATQSAALVNQGAFYPSVIEDALDKLTILQQQGIGVGLAQALRVPEIGGVSVLPAAASRASKLVGFDSSGNPTAVTPAVDSATALAALLASSAGSSNVGVVQSGTGAVTRTAQSKMRDTVSVRDFGAVGDGVTDDTAAINVAITAVNAAGGGTVLIPAGIFNCASSVTMKPNVLLQGVGKQGSRLRFTGVGDGVVMTSPINSATAVNTKVRDLGITCTNGANTGGGYVDIGGSFVDIESCYILGFKYGIIFDQTEIATIDKCVIDSQITGGIWLVNGADHTVSAAAAYTNRITITRNQINGLSTAYGIIDDGGVSHTIEDNNFNGCLQHIRVGKCEPIIIGKNEFETATGPCITFQSTTRLGTALGSGSSAIHVDSNTFLAVAGQNSIQVIAANSLYSTNNSYGGTAGAVSIAITTLLFLTSIGDRNYYGISGTPTYNYVHDSYTNGVPIAYSGMKYGNAGTATTGTVTGTLVNNYEEGTWVPNQGAGLSLTGAFSSSGKYTRIGNMITVTAKLSGATSIAIGSGGVICSNLPFASSKDCIGSLTNNSLNISNSVYVGPSTSSVNATVAVGAVPSIYFTLTYFI